MQEWASGSRGFSRQASKAYNQQPYGPSNRKKMSRTHKVYYYRLFKLDELNPPAVEQTGVPQTSRLEFPTPSAQWTGDTGRERGENG